MNGAFLIEEKSEVRPVEVKEHCFDKVLRLSMKSDFYELFSDDLRNIVRKMIGSNAMKKIDFAIKHKNGSQVIRICESLIYHFHSNVEICDKIFWILYKTFVEYKKSKRKDRRRLSGWVEHWYIIDYLVGNRLVSEYLMKFRFSTKCFLEMKIEDNCVPIIDYVNFIDNINREYYRSGPNGPYIICKRGHNFLFFHATRHMPLKYFNIPENFMTLDELNEFDEHVDCADCNKCTS